MTMDMKTRYLGLELAHPFMPGASPLCSRMDTVRQLEDAGASAIVMHSLWEEELVGQQVGLHMTQSALEYAHPEARSYLTTADLHTLGPDEYLEQIGRIREAVNLPVVASLNGVSLGGWLRYATLMESAGANALELNVYQVVQDINATGETVEGRVLELVAEVKRAVNIPIAVKILPFFTALPNLVERLGKAGAAGVVLFNRAYQPEIDIEELEVRRGWPTSTNADLPQRLMWLSLLHGNVTPDLAVSGGVHSSMDALQAIMCGAQAVQVVSALLKHGPRQLARIRDGVEQWLVEHEYESLAQGLGSMSLKKCPDPAAYDRSSYIQTLRLATGGH